MTPDDLTKPLKQAPRNQRRRVALLIIAGALSGVLSGVVILFTVNPHRGKPVLPAPVPQSPLAVSSEQSVPVPPPAPAMPTAKTITVTVIDSQTGAKREVVFPAPTGDALRSTVPVTAAEKSTAGARGGPNSKAR